MRSVPYAVFCMLGGNIVTPAKVSNRSLGTSVGRITDESGRNAPSRFSNRSFQGTAPLHKLRGPTARMDLYMYFSQTGDMLQVRLPSPEQDPDHITLTAPRARLARCNRDASHNPQIGSQNQHPRRPGNPCESQDDTNARPASPPSMRCAVGSRTTATAALQQRHDVCGSRARLSSIERTRHARCTRVRGRDGPESDQLYQMSPSKCHLDY